MTGHFSPKLCTPSNLANTIRTKLVSRTTAKSRPGNGNMNISHVTPQGGSPSPFDRIQSTTQATVAMNWLIAKIEESVVDGGWYDLTHSYSEANELWVEYRNAQTCTLWGRGGGHIHIWLMVVPGGEGGEYKDRQKWIVFKLTRKDEGIVKVYDVASFMQQELWKRLLQIQHAF